MDALRQSTGAQSSGAVSSIAKAFDSDVMEGSLLVVVAVTQDEVMESTSLTDDRGNVWRRRGFVQRFTGATPKETVGIWVARSKDSGPMTVTVIPNNADFISLSLMEFPPATWNEDYVDVGFTANTPISASTPVATGPINTSVQCTLVVAMSYGGATTTISLDAGNGWIEVTNLPNGTNAMPIAVAYQIGEVGTYNGKWTLGASRDRASGGIAFKQAVA